MKPVGDLAAWVNKRIISDILKNVEDNAKINAFLNKLGMHKKDPSTGNLIKYKHGND